ncbi:acyl-CoA synthetase [Thiothrix eikelboomii]|uniref:acyl-CoA synthetase n=1 Tax=Thiothrix eikelboomii TaxID=92487 RepID=UPI003BB0867D
MNSVANQADVQAIERSNPRLPQSTYDMIGQAAAAYAQSPALSFFLRAQDHQQPMTWDYATFFAQITATANFFHGLGLGKDAVIAFVLPNLPETHLTIWGGEATGIVLAINPLLEPAAIAELLKAGGAKLLVTLAPFPGSDLWQKLQPVIGAVPSLEHLVLVNLARYLPGAASAQEADLTLGSLTYPSHLALHDFAAGIQAEPGDRLISGRQIGADDLSSFFCTGGTTGTPKIAMRTHRNEVANAWSTGQVFGDGVGVGKTLFCGLPMFHVNAVLVTGLLPFSRGAHVLLGTPQGFRGEGVVTCFWEIVAHHRINFFSGVPTLYTALQQQPIEGHDLRSLEFGLCGAAPMSQELMRSFQERTGLKILEGYGLTEGTCVSTVNPPQGERRLGSIGLRVPLQDMKAVVLDDAGAYVRDCAVDEVGVLIIRGPNVFEGYKVAEHNRGLWVETSVGERWLNTGDLGRQDAEGYFYLTGRKKELIIRSGHNIDPAIIEELLHRHPDVLLAAAIGRPDAYAGEVPVAYVQLKPDSVVQEDELMAHARAHISEHAAIPKAIRIVSAIPLTAVGKIYKPALKQREIEAVLAEVLRNAKLPFVSLEVLQDAKLGTLVELALAEPAHQQMAQQLLGQYPFQFRITV